ncbi:LysM peptidoglycan-binding domain-containing protein [Luteolibacter arcticus]|uniref:LysM peptidoglycan-binding domain-containing protein n=1 Tax=Luteolibacter arcticus TaxID=1581411 RepID=A0ABT3GI45_9BACT|nr:LysM peptidoglycan-binding domain-containing protein [Luteolibacter arcticus]MCW1923169.1 LysM peptidoglycan-binding domain-containing protein [Luteolibacter arcticus]
MQSRWLLLPAASLSLFLNSCVNGGGGLAGASNPSGTGPFDSRGNYVEAWADNPSAWRKGNTEIVEAVPDRPAADVPVTTQQTPVLVVNETPETVRTTTTVVYKKPTPGSSASLPKPKTTTTVVKTTTKPKTSTAVAKSTPKPTVKKQVVSKSKPKSARHTVRSGENLYNIAKRYGTSVSAIQKANGVKGATIRPGQALVIPR